MHYGGNDLNDNDDDRDNQLPYKTIDVQSLGHSYVPLAKAAHIKHAQYLSVIMHYPVLKDNYLPQPALSTLFRPPKAA